VRIILFNLFMLLGVLFPGMAQAQLFIEDGKVVLSVTEGERINKFITVANTSKEQVLVKIYLEDFQYQPPYDGTKKFFPAGVGPASASKIINYSPQEISIPPFGKQKIDYTITVPDKFDKGLYGVLFFEQTGSSTKNVTGIDIVTRAGSLFFIEPKNAIRKAELDKVSLQGGNIVGTFVNKSTITLIPRIVYYFMEDEGMVKERGELKNLYVPAGETASWELPVPVSLNAGHYTLVINADLGEENVVTKEIGLTKSASDQLTLQVTGDSP
jgi:hypothetical protein